MGFEALGRSGYVNRLFVCVCELFMGEPVMTGVINPRLYRCESHDFNIIMTT